MPEPLTHAASWYAAKAALTRIRTYPACGNSDPDTMARAIEDIYRIASTALRELEADAPSPAPGRPHGTPLPTCPECLARAAYLADLTDTHLQTLFDPDTSTMARRPSEAHVHLWADPHHGIALCECDTRFRWLEATMQGWHRAWSALKARYGSYDCRNAQACESWQYVGTCYPKGHCFRHRALPPVGDRCYFHVAERPGDFGPAMEG